MTLSRDAMLALERHFVGALSAPARTWLEPVPASQLAFAGNVVCSSAAGCIADFGTVDSPGHESQVLRVINRGTSPVLVHIAEYPSWLTTRWRDVANNIVAIAAGAAGAVLELTATHDTEYHFLGRIRFLVNAEGVPRIEELPVSMTTRRTYPIALFDFNGSPVPRAVDVATVERPYRFSVSNNSSVPLVVRFTDLPEWLTFEAGGQRRNGPLAGPFFERLAPFTIQLRARATGPQRGVVRLETNDPRPQCRSVELQLSARVEPMPPRKETARSASSITTVRKPASELDTVRELPPRRTRFTIRGGVFYALAVLLFVVLAFLVRELA